MAIPTKEMFEALFNNVKWSPDESWLQYCSLRSEPPKREEVSKIIKEYYKKREEYCDVFGNQDLIKVFEAQKSWDNAINSLNYNKSRKNQLIDYEAIYEKEIDYFMNIEPSKDGVDRTKYKLVMFIEEDPLIWLKGIVQAYYDYFFTSRWQSIVELAPKVKPIISDALKCLLEFEKLSCLQEFSDSRLFTGIDSRMILKLKSLESESQILYVPIKRNDSTLRERGLVYDISAALRRRYRSNKAKAIYHFLAIEGIENNLELRTIERLLSGWREDRRARFENRFLNRQLNIKTM